MKKINSKQNFSLCGDIKSIELKWPLERSGIHNFIHKCGNDHSLFSFYFFF